jgi:peptidoglycan hydrolase-like protein with peptidoglycan-binding domain
MAESISAISVSPVAKPTLYSGDSTKLFPSTMKKGMTSDAIKDLQNVLKSDPAVYPEGLVTGYFGNLTEEAIKRLQKKYGVPVTGVMDDTTQSIIFPPRTELKILAPNGGETWDKSSPHRILWETKTSPVILNGKEVVSGTSSVERDEVIPDPFYQRASLDLITDNNCPWLTEAGNTRKCDYLSATRIYHIATVNLYDLQYNWTIPAKVPAGSNYRVRISAGHNVPCLDRSNGLEACPMLYPQYATSDVSDNTFSITGSTPPPADVIQKLKNQARQMTATLEKLMRELKALTDLINSL